ncbi:MAG: hypothetical protein CMP75_00595 [Flavobacteriales bacterium]|nr:hypothetical protein [Flavobacteriales bacterium]
MMKKVFFGLLFLISNLSFSQSFVNITSDLNLMNNNINAEDVWRGLHIGYWDTSFKTDLLNTITDNNHFFLETYNGIEYGNTSFSIAYNYRIIGAGSISKDLIELGLFGNGVVAGRELDFNNTFIDFVRFSDFRFSKSFGNKFNVSISLLNAHDLQRFRIHEGALFTEKNGEYLNYTIDYTHISSDTSTNNYFGINGIGTAVSLGYTDTINEHIFSAQVSDIGLIKWNDKTINRSLNEDFYFEGIEIENILDFNDSIVSNQTDTLLDVQNYQEEYISKLPIQLSLQAKLKLKNKAFNFLNLGIMHKFGYFEHRILYTSLSKNFKNHQISLGAKTGGIEPFGITAAYTFKNEKNHFSIYSNHLNIIDKKSAYGVHLGFGIKKVFLSKEN